MQMDFVLFTNKQFHVTGRVAIKARLLKFNMFNMYKNTISKMFLVFF